MRCLPVNWRSLGTWLAPTCRCRRPRRKFIAGWPSLQRRDGPELCASADGFTTRSQHRGRGPRDLAERSPERRCTSWATRVSYRLTLQRRGLDRGHTRTAGTARSAGAVQRIMIVLDTNVLFALMRDTPDPVVVEWLDDQPTESIWTTSVTVFEIRTGIELLAPSRRRKRLDETFSQLLEEALDGRVQSFDLTAAIAARTIAATRQRAGRAVEIRDVQIAGIAISRHATVATRNTHHFDGTSIDVINPWD